MGKISRCDDCSNFEYDEEYGCYTCVVGLDQDEMKRFLRGNYNDCPYYSFNAEYELARKQ